MGTSPLQHSGSREAARLTNEGRSGCGTAHDQAFAASAVRQPSAMQTGIETATTLGRRRAVSYAGVGHEPGSVAQHESQQTASRRDARTAVAGLAFGGLVVGAMYLGSSVLTLLTLLSLVIFDVHPLPDGRIDERGFPRATRPTPGHSGSGLLRRDSCCTGLRCHPAHADPTAHD